jgi:glycosyltransferase involved in cell wall biosynthesis
MKLNIIMEDPTVTVLTPSIGSPKLADAIQSVSDQTYSKVKHLVVVDGQKYIPDFVSVLNTVSAEVEIVHLAENTGANGFYGHRIYAAFPHLINSDYIFFLDEDNWYEPNHVETLVKVLQNNNAFAHSLRNIYDENKNFLVKDDCESLGKWPIWFTHDQPQYLVDTSSFAFSCEFLIQTSHLWHSGWGGDRRYLAAVKDHCNWNTSGLYTLNYRLDGNPNSVGEDFFIEGNAKQKERYGETLPWTKT